MWFGDSKPVSSELGIYDPDTLQDLKYKELIFESISCNTSGDLDDAQPTEKCLLKLITDCGAKYRDI